MGFPSNLFKLFLPNQTDFCYRSSKVLIDFSFRLVRFVQAHRKFCLVLMENVSMMKIGENKTRAILVS
jgi:hypothetical protein